MLNKKYSFIVITIINLLLLLFPDNLKDLDLYNHLYTAVLSYYIKVKEFKACLWNKISPGNNITRKSVLFYYLNTEILF